MGWKKWTTQRSSTPLPTASEVRPAPTKTPRLYLSFQIDKEGSAEDAPPLCETVGEISCLGVFDGLGGSGAASYQTPNGRVSGAYLASRKVRQVVRDWMRQNCTTGLPAEGKTVDLEQYIKKELSDYAHSLSSSGGRLRSSMLRTLPTTLAVLAVSVREEPPLPDGTPSNLKLSCRYYWAGDSRCYLLTPENGVQQLTRDNLKGSPDALENLSTDAPVSNCISANKPFQIFSSVVNGVAPAVFFTATDGCFGYLPSPLFFEEMLLETMAQAATEQEWESLLRDRVKQVTGDDATFAAVCVGFDGFLHMRERFAYRRKFIADLVAPLRAYQNRCEQLRKELEKAEQDYAAKLHSSWSFYKTGYERILPHLPGGGA